LQDQICTDIKGKSERGDNINGWHTIQTFNEPTECTFDEQDKTIMAKR
jgi:hypothetical protein